MRPIPPVIAHLFLPAPILESRREKFAIFVDIFEGAAVLSSTSPGIMLFV
jgi:hypothetical protein